MRNLLPVTPNKNLKIYLDEPIYSVAEPVFEMARQASAMFLNTDTSSVGLRFNSGWEVKSYLDWNDIVWERDEASAMFIPETDCGYASDMFVYGYQSRAPSNTNMPNVNSGASVNQAPRGYKAFKKRVPAGYDWSTKQLLADETSFPPPNLEDNNEGMDSTVQMDRVLFTYAPDSTDQDICFIFTISSLDHIMTGAKLRIYFNGNSGETVENGVTKTGTGQYCWWIRTGYAVLFEKLVSEPGVNSWVKRHEVYGHFLARGADRFIMTIRKSGSCFNVGEGTNGFIKTTFEFSTNPVRNTFNHMLERVANMVTNSPTRIEDHYMVPGSRQATVESPIRIDFRRDIMGAFSLLRTNYPTDPIVVDDSPFSLTEPPAAGQYILLDWSACEPGTSSVICSLINKETNTELTISSFDSANNKCSYELPEGVTDYFVRCTFVSDGDHTARLNGWRVKKNAYLQLTDQTIKEIGAAPYYKTVIRRFDMKGAERHISGESASFTIADPLKKLNIFKTRTSIPVKIVNVDSASGRTNTIFRGFTTRINNNIRSSFNDKLPLQSWSLFDITCKNMWTLLAQTTVDSPYTTTFYTKGTVDMNGNTVTNDGTPYLASEFIRALISRAGFDYDNDFDFPTDIPIRILADSGLDFSSGIDMLENNGVVIESLCDDYIFHHLIRDENLGPRGKWKLIPPPVAPYTNLVNFITTGPDMSDGQPRVTHYLPSYAGMLDPNTGLPIPTCDIVSGTFNTTVKEPECNWLLVAGMGSFDTKGPKVQCAVGHNPISYNRPGASTADPNHPDYLGRRKPMYVVDPAIYSAKSDASMQAILTAVWRRIAYLSFHAIKMATFTAPMIEIPHETETGCNRILRYYDPVLIDGEQFLIRNVNPTFTKDGMQFAVYECEAPRAV